MYGWVSARCRRSGRSTFFYLHEDGDEVEVDFVTNTEKSTSGWGDEKPVGFLKKFLRPGCQGANDGVDFWPVSETVIRARTPFGERVNLL